MSIKTSDLSFKQRMRENLSDSFKRQSIAAAQDLINQKRQECYDKLGDFEKWRDLAADIRSHVLDNLDYYLEQFVSNAERVGATVHFARDAAEANAIAREIFRKKKATKAVKSKSMVTEEIGLNEALEEIGVQILETDLGEYLLQVDNKDKPSHIVIPALHKDRKRIRGVLAAELGYDGDDVPENMTKFVRGILRQAFLSADIAVTGCNFAIAETGTIALMTNEGNGRFVTSIPKTHIVFMGMERIVPSFRELDIMFSMLARSGVGARTSVYMSLITGPKAPADVDGPEELHIIIVDNGRSAVLASEFRDVLRCIRCGACMLECPAYRHVSGHGYGVLYPGPLGAALVPLIAGYKEYKDITKICSLCGACNDVCPVKIPLYETIYQHRRIIVEREKLTNRLEDAAFSVYGNIIGHSRLYRAATRLAFLGNWAPRVSLLKEWCKSREMPVIQKERFRDWFARRRRGEA
ncbi:iron-sulfur cluster-binding protein [candidate division KSB1 bacterium]|nr:iron-sulfur cluster-binding protein [candidate division KSB1 bacterium]RQW06968.1 MAG: iron-sulfur cluster-binding protein [candidate division KSB1 bacterium]